MNRYSFGNIFYDDECPNCCGTIRPAGYDPRRIQSITRIAQTGTYGTFKCEDCEKLFKISKTSFLKNALFSSIGTFGIPFLWYLAIPRDVLDFSKISTEYKYIERLPFYVKGFMIVIPVGSLYLTALVTKVFFKSKYIEIKE